MGSASKHYFPTTTTTPKLPQNQSENFLTMRSDTEEQNLNPNPNLNGEHNRPAEAAETASVAMDDGEEESIFAKSEFLSCEEVIRRRSRRVKELIKCYKDHYWALMEEVKNQHRDYYWKYGISPFKEGDERENGFGNDGEGSGEANNNRLRLGFGVNNTPNNSCVGRNKRCALAGCKSKPMALTNYCHPHILSDSKQKLYKACTYVIKSAPAGPVLCGKPILRSTVPSLCTVHFQKAQKHVTRALKKAGLNIASSSKLAPKFHVIVAESVRQIQAKRRAARRAVVNNVMVKEENKIVVKEENGC